MGQTVIDRVTVIPGGGRPLVPSATVVLDGDGVVLDIVPGAGTVDRYLVPAAVDLHLDNLSQRRRPRATVTLDHRSVIPVLDAECAAAGIGVVAIAARCEDSPGKGIHIGDALELAIAVEELAPSLACDWRLHVRVEVTDDVALDVLPEVLAASTRVVLVSMMEHSVDRSRFPTVEENRAFYAADWGVSPDEVDRILARKADGADRRDATRREVAMLARTAGVRLASHDDASPEDVAAGRALGASIAEFPLSVEAARYAQSLGMATVLGAPNAVRGRSTAPGNLLVADAVAAGVCDVLCSDYLPGALQAAPHALAASGVLPLTLGVDLVSVNPARVVGLPSPAIVAGQPLTASLRQVRAGSNIGLALWRQGHRTFAREALGVRAPVVVAV